MSALLANEKELRALRLFVSADKSRLNMSALFAYLTNDGLTYLATDGHTIVRRSSGTHREMPTHEIREIPPSCVDADGAIGPTDRTPPAWDQVLKPGAVGKLAPAYSISPIYFGRLAYVEKAAEHRAAEDFVPPLGMSKKDANRERSLLKVTVCARLTIPSNALDGWFWAIETSAALWEGVIMPRLP